MDIKVINRKLKEFSFLLSASYTKNGMIEIENPQKIKLIFEDNDDIISNFEKFYFDCFDVINQYDFLHDNCLMQYKHNILRPDRKINVDTTQKLDSSKNLIKKLNVHLKDEYSSEIEEDNETNKAMELLFNHVYLSLDRRTRVFLENGSTKETDYHCTEISFRYISEKGLPMKMNLMFAKFNGVEKDLFRVDTHVLDIESSDFLNISSLLSVNFVSLKTFLGMCKDAYKEHRSFINDNKDNGLGTLLEILKINL